MFDFKDHGPGLAKGGTGVLTAYGKEVARKTMAHSDSVSHDRSTSFDIGPDTRSPVDFNYEVPFRFTGTIDNLTYKLGPSQISAEDKATVDRAIAIAHD